MSSKRWELPSFRVIQQLLDIDAVCQEVIQLNIAGAMLREDVGPTLCIEIHRLHKFTKRLILQHAMWIAFEPIALLKSFQPSLTNSWSQCHHIVDRPPYRFIRVTNEFIRIDTPNRYKLFELLGVESIVLDCVRATETTFGPRCSSAIEDRG